MEQRYGYRVRPTTVGMMLVVSLALGGFCGWAYLNGWGLNAYGAALAPDVARWFYLGLVALAGLVLVLGVLAIAAGQREVVITADRIVLPKGEYTPRTVVIGPHQVRDISFRTYNGIETAVIRHSGGTVRLRSPHFANRQAFSECVDWINSLWLATRTG